MSEVYDKTNKVYSPNSNPISVDGIGYTSTFDYFNTRFILTKKEVVLTEKGINNLIVINDPLLVNGSEFCCPSEPCDPATNVTKLVLNLANGIFYWTWCTIGGTILRIYEFANGLLDNQHEFFRESGWTISFSNGWTSFHSYIPNMYINTNNNFYRVLN